MNYFLSIILILFFIQCSNPTQNKTMVAGNDTISVPIKVDLSTKTAEESEIICPKCGHKKTEKLPTEICLLSYTCENCKEIMHPKDGDCCVFCSYGSHKYPSKQEN